MKIYNLYLIILCYLFSVSCEEKKPADDKKLQSEINAISVVPQNNDDEKEFWDFFNNLKIQIAKKNKDVKSIINFPFYTGQIVDYNGFTSVADPINSDEFGNYHSLIFSNNVVRLLPLAKVEDISEIDINTKENYYQTLMKEADLQSKMYEIYIQFPEAGTNSESYFAFVFGKVNGRFKVLSTYSKWPIK